MSEKDDKCLYWRKKMCFGEIGQLTIDFIRMKINEFLEGLHVIEVWAFVVLIWLVIIGISRKSCDCYMFKVYNKICSIFTKFRFILNIILKSGLGPPGDFYCPEVEAGINRMSVIAVIYV